MPGVRFPIPLVTYSSFLSHRGFVTFQPFDLLTFKKSGKFGPFFYTQIGHLTPHFMPKSPHENKRLSLDLRLTHDDMEVFDIREVLQIEEMTAQKTYNVLIHIERNNTVVYHKKFYVQSAQEVQQLIL